MMSRIVSDPAFPASHRQPHVRNCSGTDQNKQHCKNCLQITATTYPTSLSSKHTSLPCTVVYPSTNILIIRPNLKAPPSSTLAIHQTTSPQTPIPQVYRIQVPHSIPTLLYDLLLPEHPDHQITIRLIEDPLHQQHQSFVRPPPTCRATLSSSRSSSYYSLC